MVGWRMGSAGYLLGFAELPRVALQRQSCQKYDSGE